MLNLIARIRRAARRWNRMPSRRLPVRTYRIPTEEQANAQFHACMRLMATQCPKEETPHAA